MDFLKIRCNFRDKKILGVVKENKFNIEKYMVKVSVVFIIVKNIEFDWVVV